MARGSSFKRTGWELPALRETISLASGLENLQYDIEDCKFYPYTVPGLDPVCAIVTLVDILILRMPAKRNGKVEVIQAIREVNLLDSEHLAQVKEKDKSQLGIVKDGNNSICWSKTADDRPLLIVSGRSSNIKIFDPLTGDLLRTLVGHGGGVNDLAISPVNPEILASASADLSIRLWSLSDDHKDKPCIALLAGGGHKSELYTIAFHASGRYLLSSGDDQIINLWTLPGLPNEDSGTDHPTIVHYPHFSSSDVHSNKIDCVSFHGDLILSKAWAEDCILLWSINGFDSSKPAPSQVAAPTNHGDRLATRSAFSHDKPQYTRLIQFYLPGCTELYMRFSVFMSADDDHAILAACNSSSTIMFWDLARLGTYHEFMSEMCANPEARIKKPAWLTVSTGPKKSSDVKKRLRETSPSGSTASQQTSNSDVSIADSAIVAANRRRWDAKYDMGTGVLVPKAGEEEGVMLQAHREIVLPKFKPVTGRQVAWSQGGEWCVAVWSPHVVSIYSRWEGLYDTSAA